MAEITSSGYQDLREHVQSTWQYVVLKSDTNAEILRIKTDDPRVIWAHNSGDQVLILKLSLTGLDFESKPQRINKIELYKEQTGGSPFVSESFSLVTIEVDADKLTVTLKIQIPQVI